MLYAVGIIDEPDSCRPVLGEFVNTRAYANVMMVVFQSGRSPLNIIATLEEPL